MEDFRKLSKIAVLDQKIPGPVCGDPDCEELCAEAFDAALSLRLDPMAVLRKAIERELHCIPAEDRSGHTCRFGFRPSSDSLVLGGEKKKNEQADKEEIIHIFRTGINECKKCQALEGTRITPEIWADEEKMKSKGFWKQKNGEYLPHPNCKCHWKEEIIKKKKENAGNTKPIDAARKSDDIKHETERTSSVSGNHTVQGNNKTESSDYSPNKENVTKYNKTEDSSYTGEEVEFYVKGGPRKFGNALGFGHEVNGFQSLVESLEKNYKPHSIGLLRIIGHGGPGRAEIGGPEQDNFQRFFGKLKDPMTLKAISTLKKMLSSHAILELRMCSVGVKGKDENENGPEFAQKLANLLGCRVKVYLEPVNPYGWKPIVDKENKKIMPENFGQMAEYEIYAPQP